MHPPRDLLGPIREPASSLALLLAFGATFELLDRYEWGQAFVRFACLAALGGMALVVRLPHRSPTPPSAGRLERWLVAGLTVLLIERVVVLSSDVILEPPRVDIGQTTQEAVRLLFLEGENPYQSRTIAVLGDDPSMWGYKYGPAMILGYAACAVLGDPGVKATNAVLLAATLAVVAALARRGADAGDRANAAWFASALTLLPDRLWYEVFQQGVVDLLPVLPILGSILALGSGRRWTAGLLAGLSLSAKLSPGLLYAFLLVRRRPDPRLAAGFAAGLLPLVPFAAWDAGALVRNVVLFHGVKAGDATSLYSLTPPELHLLFPVGQALVATAAVARNFRSGFDAQRLVAWMLGLTLAFEALYKEVHGNHLLWILPFAALHLAWNRRWFLPGLLTVFRGDASARVGPATPPAPDRGDFAGPDPRGTHHEAGSR